MPHRENPQPSVLPLFDTTISWRIFILASGAEFIQCDHVTSNETENLCITLSRIKCEFKYIGILDCVCRYFDKSEIEYISWIW